MVLVHRLHGEPLFINADLIETIEAMPDTVVTLADGRRIMLSDPPEVVVERIRDFRASVLVAAEQLRNAPAGNVVMLPAPKE